MALGALSGSAYEVGCRLSSLNAGTLAMDEERRQNQRKCNNDGQKHRAKRHELSPSNANQIAVLQDKACEQDGYVLYQA